MKKIFLSLFLSLIIPVSAYAATSQITGRQISDNTIGTVKLATIGAPTDEQCATYEGGSVEWQACTSDNSVTSTMIVNNTIVDNDIANGTIGSLQISDNSIMAGDLNSSFYGFGSCTPTVTLVGGAGNTVPSYTTNSCRWTKTGNRIWLDILLQNTSGGTPGAGTGQINVALPFAASTTQLSNIVTVGYAAEGTAHYILFGGIDMSASTMALSIVVGGASTLDIMVGNDQSSGARIIRIKTFYEI